jgi:tetratricopeptide (TPR) repeat protein
LIPLLIAAAAAVVHSAAPNPIITGATRHDTIAASRGACPDLVTPDALVCRALEAQKAGNNRVAAQGFDEAAKASNEKDPKTARMYAAAGNLWIAANEPGKAAADLDKALALQGLEAQQRGEALLDRARAAEAQNDLATARARLNDAVATISGDPFYWYFSASLAMRERDPITARSSIDRALRLAPSDPAILFEAGHVADFTGDDDSARSYWMRAAARDPNGPVGKAATKAVEMLGVTPTLKTDIPSAKAAQPKS